MHVPWSAHEYEGTRVAPRKKSRFGPGFPTAAFVRLWRMCGEVRRLATYCQFRPHVTAVSKTALFA
jgi:hypothetical protein